MTPTTRKRPRVTNVKTPFKNRFSSSSEDTKSRISRSVSFFVIDGPRCVFTHHSLGYPLGARPQTEPPTPGSPEYPPSHIRSPRKPGVSGVTPFPAVSVVMTRTLRPARRCVTQPDFPGFSPASPYGSLLWSRKCVKRCSRDLEQLLAKTFFATLA